MRSFKSTRIVFSVIAILLFASCSKEVGLVENANEMEPQFTVSRSGQASNNNVVWAQAVQMDAMQANSTSGSTGLFIFRLSSDMILTYKFIVENIDAGDVLTNAHIHPGAPGLPGPGLIGLQAGVLNLNEFQTLQLSAQQYSVLMNPDQPLYVNIHTQLYPGNSIRGQLR